MTLFSTVDSFSDNDNDDFTNFWFVCFVFCFNLIYYWKDESFFFRYLQ